MKSKSLNKLIVSGEFTLHGLYEKRYGLLAFLSALCATMWRNPENYVVSFASEFARRAVIVIRPGDNSSVNLTN